MRVFHWNVTQPLTRQRAEGEICGDELGVYATLRGREFGQLERTSWNRLHVPG
jgi:hypothetical protein